MSKKKFDLYQIARTGTPDEVIPLLNPSSGVDVLLAAIANMMGRIKTLEEREGPLEAEDTSDEFEAPVCPYCKKPAEIPNHAMRNMEAYGRPVRARSKCCNSILYLTPIFSFECEATSQTKSDDWGN